jgi:creatinine amidohydrolase
LSSFTPSARIAPLAIRGAAGGGIAYRRQRLCGARRSAARRDDDCRARLEVLSAGARDCPVPGDEAMARGLLAALYLLIGIGPTWAGPSPSVFLQDLTWTELRADVQSGKTTILVPIGGTEENGPQMALGKHNVRAKLLCERIARALGNALVAPVIAYVPEGDVDHPTGHLQFSGTISVPIGAFEEVLEGAARSFNLAGFRNILFLGDHGGYQRDLHIVADRLDREWVGSGVRALAITEYYRASEIEFGQLLKQKGYSEAEIGTHAGLLDTSLMMGVDPRMVRADLLRETKPGDGVYGDPSRSSVALGRLGVDLVVVARTVAAIKEATARD